jgi:glycosyltransferase involved in cell wall biosynthesis
LYVGRTEDPRKNLAALVEAFAEARRMGLAADQLVIAGRQQSGTTPLKQAIEALGLGQQVRLLGAVPDEAVPDLMAGALMFVYVSTFEGFGLPVLEAMACGTPVITSNTTSLAEIAGDAALTVSPGEAAELTRAMVQLASDEKLRHALAERGLARAQEFSWTRTARETLAVYERVAGSVKRAEQTVTG